MLRTAQRRKKRASQSHGKHHGATEAPCGAIFERLEARILLAADLHAALDDGVLSVIGTNDNDNVAIEAGENDGDVWVHDKVAGTSTLFEGVDALVINLKKGDDRVEIIGEVRSTDGGLIGAQINGGKGNDTIIAGAGNDQIIDNHGDNHVNAGDGDNHVKTGKGDDTVITGSGNDTVNDRHGDNDIDVGSGSDNVNGEDKVTEPDDPPPPPPPDPFSITLGEQDFTDGQAVSGADFTAAASGEPAPFNALIGSDFFGSSFSASFTFTFDPQLVESATLTFGIMEHDPQLAGDQVLSFSVDGDDSLTAELNALFEATAVSGIYSIYTLTLTESMLSLLADGSVTFTLILTGGGGQLTNGAGLDFATLNVQPA